MKCFVSSPHFDDYVGIALAVTACLAIFVFGAPPWIMVPILITGIHLMLKLHRWADGE